MPDGAVDLKAEARAHIAALPIEALDPAQPDLFAADAMWPIFERLRAEDPVHWVENEDYGGFWSVCLWDDIMAVDSNHGVFSSADGITLQHKDAKAEQLRRGTRPSFISMDPPKHDVQRKTVSPVVAPSNLQIMGPMIRERDAVRVGEWVDEAVKQGAKLVCGGSRTGTLYQPTLVADVQPTMRLAHDELFGPAVGVTRASGIDEAIAMANQSRYGLSAGLFTQDIDAAIRFAREVDAGNLHINWGPMWRADLMPYGGLKESGFGKEGPKYAIHEMTELKTVVIHSKP